MLRIPLAAVLVLLSACSDTPSSVLAPEAAAKSVTPFTEEDFRLWGFSSGPNSTIVSDGGGEWNVCSRSSVVAPATGEIIWIDHECRTYAVPVPGDGGGETYTGGQMTATIIQSGQSTFLAAANANVDERAKIVSPPSDATVEIVAEPYNNCSFSRWELQAFNGTTTVSYDPKVIHTAAQGGTTYRAYFSCTA